MVLCAFGTEIKTLLNDSSLTDTQIESLIDATVDEYNSRGCKISNMAGVAGSKTESFTSAQRGAVRDVLRVIYASWLKNAANSNASTGQPSLTATDLISNPVVQQTIQLKSAFLIGRGFRRV